MKENELGGARSTHGRPEILLRFRDQTERFEHVTRKLEIINIIVVKNQRQWIERCK